jgi:hypothetical protein
MILSVKHCVSAATHFRKGSSSDHLVVFGLIGLLGVLAFVFSAVSPDDDEFQQGFVHGNKKRECVVQNWKSIPSVRGTLFNPVHFAVAPRRLPTFGCSAIVVAPVSHIAVRATVFGRRTDGRSPPTITSKNSL